MPAARKQVEVFTASTPLCQATVTRVVAIARHCDVMVYDVSTDEGAAQRAKKLLIVRLPAVVVDGVKLPGDWLGNVSEAVLRDAGVD
jgi:hypothetical protein